ncbi:MAG: SMP-30/gluconolactonase/LRE family protein [Comamonadaceae bacterium]|nr:MAG: SMP-30/gluconolactonase/LRE family protein [Comamonadaceae bacterium]
MTVEPVQCVLDARTDLAECPIWSPAEGAIYWADLNVGEVQRFDPASGDSRMVAALGEPVGSFALASDSGLLVATRSGIYHMPPAGGARRVVARPLAPEAAHRLNDGRCDRSGRFWVGAADETRTRADAGLYRLDGIGRCEQVLGGLTLSNALAFSPDGHTMYHADTPSHRVIAYPADPQTGALGPGRLFHHFAKDVDRPDGAAVDSLGRYWVALYGAGRMACLSPQGQRLFDVAVPCHCPTMVAFGGTDLRTLYTTSARQKRSEEELAAFPLSGAIFSVRVDAPGLPEPQWKVPS